MASEALDVVGIGNAVVDLVAHADERFLSRHGLRKGAMTLIDAARAEALYNVMGPAIEISGGSGANTAVGVASLGGRAAYVGKVADDQLGEIFRHDIRAAGVAFDTPPSHSGVPTARCFIFVTPDAQRTMQTFLGPCVELAPADIDEALVGRAQVTYLEGYLWDPPLAKQAFLKAAAVAHAAGRQVALTLSDPYCVERHRESFRDLVAGHVDILFANEAEICALWQVDDLPAALAATRANVSISAITRSADGSVVLAGADTEWVAAAPAAKVVDTTGAGDLYAAGFLFGHTRGRGLAECGRIASIAAAEIIGHVGARPVTRLADLVQAMPAQIAAAR